MEKVEQPPQVQVLNYAGGIPRERRLIQPYKQVAGVIAAVVVLVIAVVLVSMGVAALL